MLNIKADTNKITDQVRPIMEIVPTAMSAMQRAPYALTGVQRVAMYTAHCEPLCMRKMNHRGPLQYLQFPLKPICYVITP